MKSIFPVSSGASGGSGVIKQEEQAVSKKELEEVIARLNVAINDLTLARDDFESYKSQIAGAFSTGVFEADRATIEGVLSANGITSESITAGEATITRLRVENIIASLLTLEQSNLSVQDLTLSGTLNGRDGVFSGDLTANNISGSGITSGSASIDYLSADDATFKNLSVEETFSPTSIATENLTADEITSSEATITDATIDNLSAGEIGADKGRITSFESNYITHLADPQEVTQMADTGDFYILFPIFTNGAYYIEARNDGGIKLWSVELLNSIQNVQFRWSESKLGQIIDLKLGINADGSSLVQLHANAQNEHISLFRQSQSTDNKLPPAIYDADQLPDTEEALVVTEYAGTYIQDVIFTNKLHVKELDMDSLFMDVVGIMRELHLTVDYDISGDIIHPITNKGEEGQYVQNRAICNISTPTWVTPSEYVDSCDDRLIPSNAVASYDGTDYAGTKECEAEEEIVRNYPITNLGDNTVTHGSQCIECSLTVECDTVSDTLVASGFNAGNTSCVIDSGISNVGLGAIFDILPSYTGGFYKDSGQGSWECWKACKPNTYIGRNPTGFAGPIDSFYKDGEAWEAFDKSGNSIISGSNNYPSLVALKRIDPNNCFTIPWSRIGEDYRFDELAVFNCEVDWGHSDSCLMAYNKATNAIQPTDAASLNCLEVDNLKVNCDAYIGHNLYVCGKTVTTEEETVSTSSDLIVLRQNNNTGLAGGEASGIVINKYNGTNNLALITDRNGVLRVGEVSGTTSTYTTIYYKDGSWYSDEGTTVEISPAGELTSWSSKEVSSNGVVTYTNAVFTAFNYSNLSPVLGRDETTNMTDFGLLRWNESTWEANTISVPTVDGSVLKYRAPGTGETQGTYYWEKGAGIYCFSTISCYNDVASEIPLNSLVLIDDRNDYTISEDA